IEQAKALGIGTGEAGVKSAEAAAATVGTRAEEAWKASRSLGELIADVPGALAKKKISKSFADRLIAEAIEKGGTDEVLMAASLERVPRPQAGHPGLERRPRVLPQRRNAHRPPAHAPLRLDAGGHAREDRRPPGGQGRGVDLEPAPLRSG